MVIIRINAHLNHEQAKTITEAIHEQAKAGVIVLPHYCQLLNKVPADETVKVVCEQEDDSEKERMAKEFSKRLMEKICSTCAERQKPPYKTNCGLCSSGSLYRKG